jgi:hypothetical protein
MANSDLQQRAEEMASRIGVVPYRRLGHGVQGIVIEAKDQWGGGLAIKVHERFDAYERERDVYLRLRELGIDSICGSAVPLLLEYDDELQAICMTIVHRPYILDFGGAFLDVPPEFS